MNFDYCNGTIYVIKTGDTLYSISRKYNVPLAMILRANPYADVYNLKVGDEICVPQQHMMPVTPGPTVPGGNGMNNGDIGNPVRPPMGPGPVIPDMDRPPMEPGPVRPPMNRPPMGPGPVRPPMDRPEMGPGPVRPPMDRPEMGPGPVRPPMDRPEMEPGPVRSPMDRPPMGPGPVRPPMDRPEMEPGPVMPDMDRPEMEPGPVRPNRQQPGMMQPMPSMPMPQMPQRPQRPQRPVTERALRAKKIYPDMAERVRMMTADSQTEPITLFTPAQNPAPRNTGGETASETGETLWTSKKAQNTLEEEAAAMDGVQGMALNDVSYNMQNIRMANNGTMVKPDLSKDATISYVVRSGDTLSDVLGYFSMTLEEFFLYNRMDRVFLKEGMIIQIPSTMNEEV